VSNYIIAAVVILVVVLFVRYSSSSKQAAAENIAKGAEFMTANQKVDGVKTTPSGLQYLVLQQGSGTVYPKASDRVRVHYHGTLIDGTVFDSSVERGQDISFGLNQVIKGWTEGLQLMVIGEKTRLFIPSELGYGNSATGKIGPGSTLIFDVELFGINE